METGENQKQVSSASHTPLEIPHKRARFPLFHRADYGSCLRPKKPNGDG